MDGFSGFMPCMYQFRTPPQVSFLVLVKQHGWRFLVCLVVSTRASCPERSAQGVGRRHQLSVGVLHLELEPGPRGELRRDAWAWRGAGSCPDRARFFFGGRLQKEEDLLEDLGGELEYGCGQNRVGIPFWLVGEFTTHFRT